MVGVVESIYSDCPSEHEGQNPSQKLFFCSSDICRMASSSASTGAIAGCWKGMFERVELG